MRWQRVVRVLGPVVAGIALLPSAYVAGCIDGTTPDCSDAATMCGPELDAAADQAEGSVIPEAAPPSDGASDAADADLDADLDAANEN